MRFAAVARPPFAPALALCAVDPPDVFLVELLPLDDLAREELAEDFARELLPEDFDPPVLFDPPELLDPPELFADARPPAAPRVFAAAVLREDDEDDDERDPPDFAPPDLEPDDFNPDDFEDDDLDPEDDVFLVVAICIILPPKKFGVTRTKQAIDVPQSTLQLSSRVSEQIRNHDHKKFSARRSSILVRKQALSLRKRRRQSAAFFCSIWSMTRSIS